MEGAGGGTDAGRGQGGEGGCCRVILLLVGCAGEQADLHRPCLEGDGCEASQDALGSSRLCNSTLTHTLTQMGHRHLHDSFVILKSVRGSKTRATSIHLTLLETPYCFFGFFFCFACSGV